MNNKKKIIIGGIWALFLAILSALLPIYWNEIIGLFPNENSNLVIDFKTNKGNENLIYKQGEELSLFVKANQDCYIQIIYYQANEEILLLVENYKISGDFVNKEIELPYKFECSPPFGDEQIQLIAQKNAFESYKKEVFLKNNRIKDKSFIIKPSNSIIINIYIKTMQT